MKIMFYVYKLQDANGDVQAVVVNETNDNLCIGGYTVDGNYHQFDSQEAYHLGAWILSNKLPFRYSCQPMEVDVPETVIWY